jgi:hypothetical protein
MPNCVKIYSSKEMESISWAGIINREACGVILQEPRTQGGRIPQRRLLNSLEF